VSDYTNGVNVGLEAYYAGAAISGPVINLNEGSIVFADMQDGGTGTVAGTVKIGGTPVQRVVRLHDESSGRVARATVSAADGTYSFTHLDTTKKFYAIAFDYQDQYNAVIADKLSPV
jgi:hypothetical protein